MTEIVHAIEREVRALSPQYREVTVRRERGCKSSRRNVAALYVACAPLHLSSGFQVPAPIAAGVQRSQIPFGGEAQSIRGERCPAGFKEREAGVHQVATAGFAGDVIVQRWALDKQLTEDTDRTWRKRMLGYTH